MLSEELIKTLESIIGSTVHLTPELLVLLGALTALLLEMVIPNRKGGLKAVLSIVFLMVAAYFVYADDFRGSLFSEFLIVDGLTKYIGCLLIMVVALILIFPFESNDLRNKGEYHFLVLTILLGAMLVTHSMNLIVFYLAVETISISSYILTTFGFKKKNYEAGIKYLLFGALSSGIMLYGISILYGISGTFDIIDMADVMYSQQSQLLLLSLVFVFAGMFFKLAMVPMHIWVPDVYEAAPPSIVALFSVVPKVSVIVFLYRFVNEFASGWAGPYILAIIATLAIISMFIGNLSAIWQTNLKRLMGYSSIAHAGFLIIGVVAGSTQGIQALLFYATIYGFMNIGVFYLIDVCEKNGMYSVEDYSGIGRIIPVYAVAMVILMVSLTGLPPTGGFTAKFLIFSALWDTYSANSSNFLFWLFVLGLLNTVIALFYYLKIPYYMIFKTGEHSLTRNIIYNSALSCFTIIILITFFKADLLVNIINKFNFAF